MSGVTRLEQFARRMKRDTLALYLAARHPGTPWYAKLLAGGVAAYALSPIDLIPDFVPVLGYLDDLLIVPAGIAVAIRLVPDPVMRECREAAEETFAKGRPVSRPAIVVIVAIWVLLASLLVRVAWKAFAG